MGKLSLLSFVLSEWPFELRTYTGCCCLRCEEVTCYWASENFDSYFCGRVFCDERISNLCSLMQEPFRSVPLVWIVHEDILSHRLPVYQRLGQNSLISHWRSAFARANVVVFPHFTLPVDSCPQ